jgi:DNA gyrase subunit A (EC 5.99.1.3)
MALVNVPSYLISPCHKRGGQGVIAIQTTERNGAVVGAVLVSDDDEIMLITDAGTLVRTRINEITVVGRNTQGVTIIKLGQKRTSSWSRPNSGIT